MEIFMGYDAREDLAYRVAKHSLEKYGATVKPLVHKQLRDQRFFDRPWRINENGQWTDERDGTPVSTEFSFTRFLTPSLSTAKWSLFVDCDILCVRNIRHVFDLADDRYAVQVVKHNYRSPNTLKMDGVAQVNYSKKKLWSSLILWNNEHPANRILTPAEVNHRTGRWLHEFQWLREDEIGALPPEWNYIPNHSVGIPALIHWTEGGPWMDAYKNSLYSHEWNVERLNMLEKEVSDARSDILQ